MRTCVRCEPSRVLYFPGATGAAVCSALSVNVRVSLCSPARSNIAANPVSFAVSRWAVNKCGNFFDLSSPVTESRALRAQSYCHISRCGRCGPVIPHRVMFSSRTIYQRVKSSTYPVNEHPHVNANATIADLSLAR